MEEETIHRADDFHGLVGKISTNAIYRGVSNSSYELLTRVGRSILANQKLLKKSKSYSYIVDEGSELAALNEFKRRALPYLDKVPNNDWEWLALAQHHGLPTRLMDWTSNPLVALFFALGVDQAKRHDATIFVIKDEYILEESNMSESPFDIASTSFFNPDHSTRRITAQSGSFTVHDNPVSPYDNENLIRWTIKRRCFKDLKAMLKRYEVHEAMLFPDLDGLAKHTKELYGL